MANNNYSSNTQKKKPLSIRKNDETEVLHGELYYARVGEPISSRNTKEGVKEFHPRWELSLALTKTGVEKAKDIGLRVYEPTANIPKPYVAMMRRVKDGDEVKSRPKVFDLDGNPIPKETLIGNGSQAAVHFRAFGEEHGNKGAAILDVQVHELIEYVPPKKDGSSSSDKGGNTAPKPTPTTARKPVSYSKKTETAEILDDDIPF